MFVYLILEMIAVFVKPFNDSFTIYSINRLYIYTIYE